MARTHLYSVTDRNGDIHTRRTARTYSHVILVRPSIDWAREVATWSRAPKSSERHNYRYYAALAAGTHAHCSFTSDAEIARCQALLADYPTEDAYIEHLVEEALARVEEKKAAGYYNKLAPAGWCGREDLALSRLHAEKASRCWAEVIKLPAGEPK